MLLSAAAGCDNVKDAAAAVGLGLANNVAGIRIDSDAGVPAEAAAAAELLPLLLPPSLLSVGGHATSCSMLSTGARSSSAPHVANASVGSRSDGRTDLVG